MRFLAPEECRSLTRKRGVDCRGLVMTSRNARHLTIFDLYYESRIRNGPEVAEALVAHLGGFASRLVCPCDLPWGDRSIEDPAPAEWQPDRDWRRKQGEFRALRDAPGHMFEAL